MSEKMPEQKWGLFERANAPKPSPSPSPSPSLKTDASSPITPRSPARPPRHAVRAVAPLAALLYPALIWCGSRSSPIVLATSLVVPLLGLMASHRIAPADGFPRARGIAHFAVAAPPLFALLGGWLDFQRALPIGSLGVW